jgi:hypothetical protein
MQETLAPTTQAGWSPRDRQLMSNLPYAQATIPEEYRRHIVQYTRREAPGSIVVDSTSKFLYYVLPKGQAIRYCRRGRTSLERHRHSRPEGRMAIVDPDRRGTCAAWAPAGLRGRGTAKSDGCARVISVLRGQGHAVSHPRHQPAGIYWPRHLLGLHPHDQRGRDRPLQSRQGRRDCRCPGANALVIRSPKA